MQLLVIAAVLLAVAAILAAYTWICRRAVQNWRIIQKWDAADVQWEIGEYSEQGTTRVYLKKVARTSDGVTCETAEQIFIQAINDSDPAWEDKYKQARQKAYDRAITLNYPV